MTVRTDHDTVFLEGDCGVEDAENLASALMAAASARVDLSSCRQLHSAVVQALLTFQPSLDGSPGDSFLNGFVLPALERAAAGTGIPSSPEQTPNTPLLELPE
jgi:hypothetical protein